MRACRVCSLRASPNACFTNQVFRVLSCLNQKGGTVIMFAATPRRLVAWVTGALMLISFARTSVLFLESMAAVRDERDADIELLEICKSGAARGSTKMRGACLQAQADRASPLVLKAIVRAVATAWREFSDAVSTPYGMLTVVLFLLSSLVMPIIPWIRMIGRTMLHPEDEEHSDDNDMESDRHVIVLAGSNGTHSNRGGLRKRVSRMFNDKNMHAETARLRHIEMPASW